MNKLKLLIAAIVLSTASLGGVAFAGSNHNKHNHGHHEHSCQAELDLKEVKAGCEGDTDVCPNLDGFQGNVPEGLVKDEQGNCVEEEVTPEPTPTPTPTPVPAPEQAPLVEPGQVPQMK